MGMVNLAVAITLAVTVVVELSALLVVVKEVAEEGRLAWCGA